MKNINTAFVMTIIYSQSHYISIRENKIILCCIVRTDVLLYYLSSTQAVKSNWNCIEFNQVCTWTEAWEFNVIASMGKVGRKLYQSKQVKLHVFFNPFLYLLFNFLKKQTLKYIMFYITVNIIENKTHEGKIILWFWKVRNRFSWF